jgi:hypothetical protein
MANVSTAFNVNPITILSQDNATVTFNISNPFGAQVAAVYYQYPSNITLSPMCYSETQVPSCPEPIKVTARCMTDPPLAIVDVWFVDPLVVKSNDKFEIPDCCEPKDEHSSMPIVQYTFKVYCKSKCVQATSSRRTMARNGDIDSRDASEFERIARDEGLFIDPQGEQDRNIEGHFCKAVDYRCGEKDNMVNVCHYSTKDGYQTYCVPEVDSDVIAYAPKDYCGPCVGGYGSSTHRN